MIFQSKIDRAMKKLREDSENAEQKENGQNASFEPDEPILEKNDFLAMVIAAFITILPAALLVLAGIAFLGYFFLMR